MGVGGRRGGSGRGSRKEREGRSGKAEEMGEDRLWTLRLNRHETMASAAQ